MNNDLRIGIIGGTGLGERLRLEGGERREVDTPFGRPSDAILEMRLGDVPVLFLSRHGPGHLLNPTHVPFRANVFALKQLGCTHIIASGAVGALREEYHPRDLVVADQVIDKTTRRAETFFDEEAVHVEFSEPFCPVLRQILIDAGKSLAHEPPPTAEQAVEAAGQPGADKPAIDVPQPAAPPFTVHERGCYVCMEGPAFSTRAESLMHRLWGGDLIGMTAMPEAKLAREAEISYALVALVTDYDCWRATPASAGDAAMPSASKAELLREIMGNLAGATDNAVRLIRTAVEMLVARSGSLPVSPAHSALELAIWSDKKRIPEERVQRLRPLWIRYLEERGSQPPSDEPTGG